MKIKANFSLIMLLGIIVSLLSACGPSLERRAGDSGKTGWAYNDVDWGGFEVIEYIEQEAGPGLVLIEGGTFTMGSTEQDVMFDWNSVRRRVTVSSFYMDEMEVSNLDYLEYLRWTARIFIEYPEIYQRALPDTLVWRSRLAYNEPYVKYYFRHPAYQDYPVVGVSWDQANEYCIWRTDRVNEKLLIDAGFLELTPDQLGSNNFNTDAYLAGQYDGATGGFQDLEGNDRNARMEDGVLQPKYRLPTEAEWEYAALALIGNSEQERIYTQKIYPWNGHYVRNPEKVSRGLFMANSVRGRGDYMGVAGYLNDRAAPTAPVDAYWPNDYGLYCMAGNVNEWVLDVYRDASSMDIDEFNPFRGNVFETLERNAEGGLLDKNDTTGQLRTRPMGQITQFSELTQDDVNHENDRYNYRKADNKNYGDGDARSTIGPDWIAPPKDNTQQMYNYDGNDPKTHQMANSLVNDNVRVYKGGGWRDRVYWLVPGTRRFLQQERSTNDIGFRCAMIRVGSPEGY